MPSLPKMLLFLLYGHFTGRLPVYLLSFYQLTWLSYITLPSVLYRNPSFTAFLSSSNTSILRWAYIPLSLLYSLLTVPVAILFVLRYLTIHLVRLTRRYWAILFVLSVVHPLGISLLQHGPGHISRMPTSVVCIAGTQDCSRRPRSQYFLKLERKLSV